MAGDVQSVSQGTNVRNLTVDDTASNVAGNWDTLVSLYDGGNGQLKGITLNDANPLMLTSAQQTSGAAMIADLLANESIETL